jgi:hypothetical protein
MDENEGFKIGWMKIIKLFQSKGESENLKQKRRIENWLEVVLK